MKLYGFSFFGHFDRKAKQWIIKTENAKALAGVFYHTTKQ
jgi:hypothetical protein